MGFAKDAERIMIVGAIGYDFHFFNRVLRKDPTKEVVAFTYASEQNVGTTGDGVRTYPAEIAGELYPEGIPMFPVSRLQELIRTEKPDAVYLAYSDLSSKKVMEFGQRVQAAGAEFRLPDPWKTMIPVESIPVTAVCAVRTGCGKSQVSTRLMKILKKNGKKAIAVREPMPYGDLVQQRAMRFSTMGDMVTHQSTVEEREEYEQYVEQGLVIWSGVDYETILEGVLEENPDVLHFDGGNNEVPFYVPDILFTVVDPLRPGHENEYYPGGVNLRMADYIIVNKVNNATDEQIATVRKSVQATNPNAGIIYTDSVVTADITTGEIAGLGVLVIDDGPTLTHGGMAFGAGYVATKQKNGFIIDPKPYLRGSLEKTFEEFSHLDRVVPAMGYSPEQLQDLEDTINAAQCTFVVSGSPIDLARLINVNKPIVRARYHIEERTDRGEGLTIEGVLRSEKII